MKNIKISILCAVALAMSASGVSASVNSPVSVQENVVAPEQTSYSDAKELPGEQNVVANHPEDAEAWATSTDGAKKELTRQQVKEKELKEKDSFGGAVTLMSMVIVISCLAILAILFLGFGAVSSYFQRQRKMKARGPVAVEQSSDEDSGETIAAIAAALAEHFSGKHDIEDTVLTIKRMKRAYSPWNSKIYNLRVTPTVRKR